MDNVINAVILFAIILIIMDVVMIERDCNGRPYVSISRKNIRRMLDRGSKIIDSFTGSDMAGAGDFVKPFVVPDIDSIGYGGVYRSIPFIRGGRDMR